MRSRIEQYSLFDSTIGPFGIAWSDRGLTRLQLPEADRLATEKRLVARFASRCPHEPSPPTQQAIADIQRYLTGARVEFSAVGLDLEECDAFARAVYRAARSVGWGHTASYGEIANLAGYPGEAREVGQALARNPIAIIIPCHRILAKGNKIGGFSAHGGTLTKERLLSLEGVDLQGDTPLLPGLLPEKSIWQGSRPRPTLHSSRSTSTGFDKPAPRR